MSKIKCKYCEKAGSFELEGATVEDFYKWSDKNGLWVSAVHGYICPDCCVSHNVNGRGEKCPICAEHRKEIKKLRNLLNESQNRGSRYIKAIEKLTDLKDPPKATQKAIKDVICPE